MVRLGDADDFDFRAVQRLGQESVHMPVNQADDADAEGRFRGSGLCGRQGHGK